MFDTVCTLPLASDLFALATHPTEPLIATGLATGHVSILRLPSHTSPTSTSVSSPTGKDTIATQWSTRRHPTSCRSLTFTPSGDGLFSAGADGLVKYCPTATGRVTDKIAVPDADSDAPCLLHALSDRTLLLATDSGALHLYDLREGSGGWAKPRPAQTLRPHADYISSLTPLPPTKESTSGVSKQWVTTGGSTLAVSDLRRGVLVQSEDQEDVLLSSCAVGGLGHRGTSVGEKVLVGGGGGVLTLWERGQWDDQDERIIVDKQGESLDVLAELPDGIGGGKTVAVGMGDGKVRLVRLGQNKVVGQVRHDDVEGVVGIGFDAEGRMITGGGMTIKVWHEKVDEDNGAYVDEGKRPGMKFSIYDDDSEEEVEEEEQQQKKKPAPARDDSDSDDDEGGRRKKKRKAGNKGGHLNGVAGNFSFTGLD